MMQIVGVAGITRLLLHSNEPQIGFVGKRHETTLEHLVWAIELFAAKLGLTSVRRNMNYTLYFTTAVIYTFFLL
jgi:hypothetical protein